MNGRRDKVSMLRCIHSFEWQGERFQAPVGASAEYVHRDHAAVLAHPEPFELANPRDEQTRTFHQQLLTERSRGQQVESVGSSDVIWCAPDVGSYAESL